MGLKETIKETKEQLEEAIEREKKLEETALAELGKVEETAEPETKSEEKPKDEKPEEKAEEKPVEEAKPEEKTATGYAKERKAAKDKLASDLAAANARIAALEASLKPAVVEQKPIVDPEPDMNANPTAWTAWKIRKQEEKIEKLSGWKAEQETVRASQNLRERAMQEVQVYENQLRPNAPDYDDVKNYYARMLATSIKIVNPKITNNALAEAVNNRLLTRASELLAEGYENPIEAMYLEAKSLGYQPEAKSDAKEEKEQPKPDMDKVSKLRSRNAGMAGASGGGGESDVTAKVAAGMTNAEFAKLKPEQKKRLFASLR